MENLPLRGEVEENNGIATPSTPLQAGIDDNKDRRGISPLSSVDTVVPSVTQDRTRVKSGMASQGTGRNFTGTAIPTHIGSAMSVRNYLTSTPVRTEAGQPPIQDISVVGEPQEKPKRKHVRGGRCLTHGKQTHKMHRLIWATIPGTETRKRRRQMYWQCDLDPKGRHALLQTSKAIFW